MPLANLLGTTSSNRNTVAAYEARGDWAGLVKFADENLAKDRAIAEWWFVKGGAEGRLGQWQAARISLAEAVRLKPHELDHWFMLARAESQSGDHATALRTLERTLDITRDNPQAYVFLGDTYRAAGRLTESERAYTDALGIKPAFAEAWFGLGVTQIARRDLAAAQATLAELRRRDERLAAELERRLR